MHHVGARARAVTGSTASGHLAELDDDVMQEALRSGTDLRAYSRTVEQQLHTVEAAALANYIAEAEQIAGLHNEMAQCDQVLEHVETMLEQFQHSLGAISSDIQSLQSQSAQLTHQLSNRKQLRAQLSQFVDDIIITKHMIQVITQGTITDREYVECVHELHRKLTLIHMHAQRDVRCTNDVLNVAETLKNAAVENIREFLISRIYELRKPLSNLQLPTLKLLEYRFYYEFIREHESPVAKQVHDEFVDTVSKVFYTYFKTYTSRVLKLQLTDVATATDLLANEDNQRGAGTSTMANAISVALTPASRGGGASKSRATIYSLGTRLDTITTEIESAIIVPHLAAEKNMKYHFESLFRSVQYALIEHASHEYLFITDFFMHDGAAAANTFNAVMAKSIDVVKKGMDEHIVACHDAIALLLCIEIVYKYEALMQRRQVHVMSGYWHDVLAALWTRLDHVLHAHINSLRTIDVKRVCAQGQVADVRQPHFIVRRYAELTSALLCIGATGIVSAGARASAGALDAAARSQALCVRMSTEVHSLLQRITAHLYSQDNKRAAAAYLINNYDLVFSVYSERVPDDSREMAFVRELLTRHTQTYVDEILFPHFGALIAFVNDTEPLIAQAHVETLRRYAHKVANIIESFSANWKQAIEAINGEVMQTFPNFKNGTNILQMTLSSLVQYYHRLHRVLQHEVFAQYTNQLVNVHTIMVEVKKYKSNF